jgi:hypothetical protein
MKLFRKLLSRDIPGNANLQIGELKDAIRENGVPKAD